MSTIRRSGPPAWRSRLLRRGAAAAMSVALIVGVAACAPASKGDGGSASAALSDTLTFGAIGGTGDSVNPYPNTTSAMTTAMAYELYEGLTTVDSKGKVVMALAKSLTHNAALDVWTVHLRPGVKKHDGKTFDADDVIYSLKYILDPANGYAPSSQISFIDPTKITKIDDLTVQIGLKQPYGPFAAAMSSNRLSMVGAESTKDDPVGTGPFTLASFTAGQQAQLTRFDDYWGEKPKFRNLKMVTFQEQSALTNALRGGQVQVISSAPFSDIAALKSTPGIRVLESPNATKSFISFRVDLAPFDDPRVREAMRLIIDRKQIVDNAYDGYATIANDINGNDTACPAPNVPQRTQDIPQARKLLAEAGVKNLKIEIVTDNGFSGMLQYAQLFAQDAAEAGVTVTVRQLDSATFLSKWRQWPALMSFAQQPYITLATRYYLAGGENNASHWEDPEYAALAKKLYATADEKQECSYITQMQKIEYERGGDIIAAYPKALIPYSAKVHGLHADLYGRSSYDFAGVTVDK